MRLQLLYESSMSEGVLEALHKMNPDVIYTIGTHTDRFKIIPFIYTPDGKLATGEGDETHFDIASNFRKKYNSRARLIEDGYILGRIVNDLDLSKLDPEHTKGEIKSHEYTRFSIAAIWNPPQTKNIITCIGKIRPLLGMNPWLWIQGNIRELNRGHQRPRPEPTPSETKGFWDPAMLRKFHTMDPTTKRAFGQPKPNPNQPEPTPGYIARKKWASTSESKL